MERGVPRIWLWGGVDWKGRDIRRAFCGRSAAGGMDRAGSRSHALLPWEAPLCLNFPSVRVELSYFLAMFKADLGALGTPWHLCSSFV